MRLIDADKLMGHLMDWALHDNATEIRECMEAVKEQPTVDPVKHGHFKAWWHGIDNPMTYTCSVCGFHNTADTQYCPHCGARMDEEG